MHVVQPKKQDSNKLIIKVNQFNCRRGVMLHGKTGRHTDKRKPAKVNQRASFKQQGY